MKQHHKIDKSCPEPVGDQTSYPDRAYISPVQARQAADLFMMGCRYQLDRHPASAIDCYRKALALKPDLGEACYNLGVVYQDRGCLDDALTAYQRVLELQPKHSESILNMGAIYQDLGCLEQAIECHRRVLNIRPDFDKAHLNLGYALLGLGKTQEAVASCRRALRLNPAYAEAYNFLGTVLLDQGQYKKAAGCYRKAFKLNPDYSAARSNLLLCLNYDPGVDQKRHFSEAKACWHACETYPGSTTAAFANTFDPERRLRIGFVSPDFRRHSVSCFFLPLISCFNKDEYEVFCYAEVRNPDEVTGRIKTLSDHWRITVGLTDKAVVEKIREDRIDILVDLAGHTAGNRLDVFLRKPAPVQVTWLGYPNTTGMPGMQYRLTDSIADPIEVADHFHTETLIRLPNGFLCYSPPDEAPVPIGLRSTPQDPITFGCFNNLSKINETVIAVWSKILLQVPGACLLLKSKQLADQTTRHRILALFQQNGIPQTRIKTLPRTQSLRDHFSLYNNIDISLDPFPYNGTTSTCDALWMGVPVVVLTGNRHASRVGTSILNRLGLKELIAESAEAYIDLAVRLAGDPAGLKSYRRHLRENMRSSALCNAESFAADLDDVFREVWRRCCNGAENKTAIKTQGNLEALARFHESETSRGRDRQVEYYNRGMDFQQQGILDKAIQYYQKALAIKPNLPEASYNMGIALLDLSSIDEAISCFKLAVASKPDYADAYNNLGNAYRDKGDIRRAISCYRQAIEINPRDPRPYYNLGNAHVEIGELAASNACFQKALALKPDYAMVYNSLGNSCSARGDLELALVNYSKAIDFQPDLAEVYYNRGNVLRKLGRNSAALASYREAVRLRDDYHDAYNNIGNLLRDLGDLDAAGKNYRLALNARPDFAEARFNLGNIMLQKRQPAAAIENFDQALALKPTYAEAHSNTGNAYKELGRYRDAILHYNKALDLKPDLAEANFNRSIIYLLHRDFRKGWEGFEWRFKLADMNSVYPHRLKTPRWDGTDFKGSRLLVHCEQGLGDTLQFVRYLPVVKALGGSVIFETRKELLGILKKVPGIDSLIERTPGGNPTLLYDYHIPLMSLAGVFQTRLETIPSHTPYLFAEDRKVVKWRRYIAGSKPEFKIGIVWAGRPGHTNDHNRSCDLDLFLPLSQIPGLRLFSLQKGEAVARMKRISVDGAIVNLGENFVDFEDTAGAIANLDLIISVDTAVAHLAGAMGKPVWLLLPFVPDWRWMLERTDSPWYPTMRLFRQPGAGDWNAVFRSVEESVKTLIGRTSSALEIS